MIQVTLESEQFVLPYTLNSAATTNASLVYNGTSILTGWACTNTNASARYVKLYDLGRPPVVGTDYPAVVIAVPGNASGAGNNYSPARPITFLNGISLAITTGAAYSDTGAVAANEIIVNLFYKGGGTI